MIRFLILICTTFILGCSQTEVKKPLEYEGPVRELEKVELYYSEKDRVKIKMKADLLYEFESGDQEFPKGVYIEFYDESGNLESTLKANHAYFFKSENKWRGRDKVEVKNIIKNEQLNTEELFWKRDEKKIFTDKFVTIRQQSDVLYGQGLDAKEDLSDYTILKPEGTFSVDE